MAFGEDFESTTEFQPTLEDVLADAKDLLLRTSETDRYQMAAYRGGAYIDRTLRDFEATVQTFYGELATPKLPDGITSINAWRVEKPELNYLHYAIASIRFDHLSFRMSDDSGMYRRGYGIRLFNDPEQPYIATHELLGAVQLGPDRRSRVVGLTPDTQNQAVLTDTYGRLTSAYEAIAFPSPARWQRVKRTGGAMLRVVPSEPDA